ncbi:MAG TPA: hypothetical protein VGC42_12760 [Kofleriaceae bacterium]
MGIFSRLFQRGQDGNPTDAPAGGDGEAVPQAETGSASGAVTAPSGAAREASVPVPAPAPLPAPAAEPPPSGPGLPGLTPAFAGAGGAGAMPMPSDAQRSIWDWPGPMPGPRRDRPSSQPPSTTTTLAGTGALPAPGQGQGQGQAPGHDPGEARPARGGSLPSVPRGEPGTAPAASGLAADKGRDPTMVVSPPPAPAPAAPARGKKGPPSPPPGAPSSSAASGSGPTPKPAPASAPIPSVPSVPGAALSPAASSAPAPSAPAPSLPAPTPTGAPTSAAVAPPAPAAAAPIAAPAPPIIPPSVPPSVPPASERPARRAHSDSVSAAFDQAFAASAVSSDDGISTEEDLAEVRSVFNDVAAVHVAQVRDVMLELRYGEAQPSWIESTQPALRSLRAMAGAMELDDLVAALDEFCVAVDAAVSGRAQIDDAGKAALLVRYQTLIELIPQAFELDAERDRREPIIVEALLHQIPGVERRTIEKLFAVGLHRLDALMRAAADEIEVVAGVRLELAEAIVEQFKVYRTAASSALSAPDPLAERRQLGDLLIMMSVANDEYVHAASKWTDEARAKKQEARKQREQAYQRIKVALARLGERDQLARLEKLPFDERIAQLDRYLSAAVPSRSQQTGK